MNQSSELITKLSAAIKNPKIFNFSGVGNFAIAPSLLLSLVAAVFPLMSDAQLATETGRDVGTMEGHVASMQTDSNSPSSGGGQMPQYQPILQYRESSPFTGWNFFAEYLLWKVSYKDNAFVLSPNAQFPSSVVEAPQSHYTAGLGNYEQAEYGLASGVRAELGYTFSQSLWQIVGQYTYLPATGSNTFQKTDPSTFPFATYTDVSATGLETALSSLKLSYQTADLLLGKQWSISDQVLWKFSFGLTGAWISEHWDIDYLDEADDYRKVYWRYQAGGPRLSADTNWHFGKGFGLFGKASLAAFVGNYKQTANVTLAPASYAEEHGLANPIINHSNSGTLVVPQTQFALGLDWGCLFNTWALRLMIGGEVNTYFDGRSIYLTSSGSAHNLLHDKMTFAQASNLNLYGLTIRMAVDF